MTFEIYNKTTIILIKKQINDQHFQEQNKISAKYTTKLQYSSTDCINQHPIRKYGTCMRKRMPTKVKLRLLDKIYKKTS